MGRGKMKNNPYGEFINFQEEMKEYKRLCRGRSKKYKFYSEWEEHMGELISPICDQKRLKDFKRFLINRERITEGAAPLYIQFVLLFIAVWLDKDDSLSVFSLIALCSFAILITMLQEHWLKLENTFYKDVLEIVEEVSNMKRANGVYKCARCGEFEWCTCFCEDETAFIGRMDEMFKHVVNSKKLDKRRYRVVVRCPKCGKRYTVEGEFK